MKSGIYEIRNLATGKSYVGSAANLASRFASHRAQLRSGKHRNARLLNAWRHYGEGAFVFRVLLRCAKKDLVMYEQRAIDSFDAVGSGYNILPVAGSALGFKHSAEHRASMAGNQLALGHRHDAETLARMAAASLGNQYGLGVTKPQSARDAVSKALSGRKQSAEHVARRLAAHVGATRSEEARANMRAAWVARKAKAGNV